MKQAEIPRYFQKEAIQMQLRYYSARNEALCPINYLNYLSVCKVTKILVYSPFYSCMLNERAYIWKQDSVHLVLMQSSLVVSHNSCC